MKCETQCHSGQKSPCYLVAELEAEPVLWFLNPVFVNLYPSKKKVGLSGLKRGVLDLQPWLQTETQVPLHHGRTPGVQAASGGLLAQWAGRNSQQTRDAEPVPDGPSDGCRTKFHKPLNVLQPRHHQDCLPTTLTRFKLGWVALCCKMWFTGFLEYGKKWNRSPGQGQGLKGRRGKSQACCG